MKRLIFLCLGFSLLVACGGGAKSFTGADVVAAFKSAGLEAENSRDMTKEDYGVAPFVCKGTRFFIPSLGPDNGGRIYACDNDKDRDALAKFYTDMGESSAILFSWVYLKENIVVQINGDLNEDSAKQYEAALNGMK